MIEIPTIHWTKIQTINYSIKPTPRMIYLGEEIALKALIKGEKRNNDLKEIRLFLFDKDYVYHYFAKNLFEPMADLTEEQLFTLLKEFYQTWKSDNL